MKKLSFILNCIAMLAILALFCFGVVMPQYEGDYQAAMIDKVERLKSMEGEKIVLIGDSNLPFGIDSGTLEQKLGKPVVNMGMHGGTGDVFNEQAALLNVHEGDLYIVCPSRYDEEDRLTNPHLCWITIENHFSLYPLIRPKDWPDMIAAYPTYLGKCAKLWRTGTGNSEMTNSYRRSAFNEYGDNYYPRPASEENIDFSYVTISTISDTTVQRLNSLYDKLQAKGADMVIAAYPIALCEGVPDEAQYAAFEQELRDKLKAEVISDFNSYRYDVSYFYDTHLHLTDEGVAVRTGQLAADVEKYREENQ